MKQILEVGDRVMLESAMYIPDYLGATGVVSYVAKEPNDDGTRTVAFVLDAESQLWTGKRPGFQLTTSSANVRYLEPEEKPKPDYDLTRGVLNTLIDAATRGPEDPDYELQEAEVASFQATLDLIDRAEAGLA